MAKKIDHSKKERSSNTGKDPVIHKKSMEIPPQKPKTKPGEKKD